MSAIMSPASVKAGDNSYANILHPVGTGPYTLVQRTRGSKLVFDRYDNYWGKKPYYSKVVFKIVPESNRSEEHTSELQSLMRNSYAVFCLKKKKKTKKTH